MPTEKEVRDKYLGGGDGGGIPRATYTTHRMSEERDKNRRLFLFGSPKRTKKFSRQLSEGIAVHTRYRKWGNKLIFFATLCNGKSDAAILVVGTQYCTVHRARIVADSLSILAHIASAGGKNCLHAHTVVWLKKMNKAYERVSESFLVQYLSDN